MLYITTRGQKDAFTAHRALCNDYAPDGGRYIPFKMPEFGQEFLAGLRSMQFGEIVTEIMNVFFSAGLNGLDVDYCVGKTPVKLVEMSHRICVAENWHNPQNKYSHIVDKINQIISENEKPSLWVATSVRIATLFALYIQMLDQKLIDPNKTFDVAVNGDDFADVMAVWYARKYGLPVGNIICTCVDNSIVWDLLHRGVYSDGNISPELQMGLEQLLCATLGYDAVAEFNTAVASGKTYSVCEALLPVLNKGIFCSVVGQNRADVTRKSVFRSNGYILDTTAALCYGGLQDYRAKTGSTNMTLVLSDKKPDKTV